MLVVFATIFIFSSFVSHDGTSILTNKEQQESTRTPKRFWLTCAAGCQWSSSYNCTGSAQSCSGVNTCGTCTGSGLSSSSR